MTENPFNMLNSGGGKEAIRQMQALAWESRVVKHTLQRVGAAHYRKRMERQAKEETGETHITFAMFNERFPTFPVLLGGDAMVGEKPLHTRADCIHPVWFKTFMKLPFVESYEELYDALLPETKIRPVVAMVFRRKGFAQGLVIHNGCVDDFVPPNGSCHVHVGGKKKPVTLVVQPYDAFIKHIYRSGRGWKPED